MKQETEESFFVPVVILGIVNLVLVIFFFFTLGESRSEVHDANLRLAEVEGLFQLAQARYAYLNNELCAAGADTCDPAVSRFRVFECPRQCVPFRGVEICRNCSEGYESWNQTLYYYSVVENGSPIGVGVEYDPNVWGEVDATVVKQ